VNAASQVRRHGIILPMVSSPRRAASHHGATLALALGALLLPDTVLAIKPCGPETWLADPTRPAAAYARAAAWVAVGVILRRVERKVPAPDCALPDRTRCAQLDRSELTIRVERYEQGAGPAELKLTAAPCAPDPPATAGGRFRLFGWGRDQYAMLEPLPAKP
jgi:hypothetical protein